MARKPTITRSANGGTVPASAAAAAASSADSNARARTMSIPSIPVRPRSLSSMSSSSAMSSDQPALSFKELQRLNAMQMEFFGFAGWLASTLLYVLFLVWAYLPDARLEAYGFSYLPSKHWALAMPSMLVVTYLFSIVLYKALNLLSTPSMDSYATVLDTQSVFLNNSNSDSDNAALDALDAHADAATPPICDIPIFQVNAHMLES